MLQLLGVDSSVLKEALTHKKIIAKGEEVCLLVTTLLIYYETYMLRLSSFWLGFHAWHLFIYMSGLQLMSPLNQEQASSARDALSKAIYGRTFTWLVNKINASLSFKVHSNINLFMSVILEPQAVDVIVFGSLQWLIFKMFTEDHTVA